MNHDEAMSALVEQTRTRQRSELCNEVTDSTQLLVNALTWLLSLSMSKPGTVSNMQCGRGYLILVGKEFGYTNLP